MDVPHYQPTSHLPPAQLAPWTAPLQLPLSPCSRHSCTLEQVINGVFIGTLLYYVS